MRIDLNLISAVKVNSPYLDLMADILFDIIKTTNLNQSLLKILHLVSVMLWGCYSLKMMDLLRELVGLVNANVSKSKLNEAASHSFSKHFSSSQTFLCRALLCHTAKQVRFFF